MMWDDEDVGYVYLNLQMSDGVKCQLVNFRQERDQVG